MKITWKSNAYFHEFLHIISSIQISFFSAWLCRGFTIQFAEDAWYIIGCRTRSQCPYTVIIRYFLIQKRRSLAHSWDDSLYLNPLIYNCDLKTWEKKVENRAEKKSWKWKAWILKTLDFERWKKLRLHLPLTVGNDFATEFHSFIHQTLRFNNFKLFLERN